jgi:hypothetical protein
MLEVFRRKVRRMAKRHLSRRSQNSYVNWEAFNRFTDLHPLVGPQRLTDVIALDCLLRRATARQGVRKASEFWEPDALTAHVRICEGPRVNAEGHEKNQAPPNRWMANRDSNK